MFWKVGFSCLIQGALFATWFNHKDIEYLIVDGLAGIALNLWLLYESAR